MKKIIITGFIAILLLAIPKDATAVTYEQIPMGEFKLTAYCPCYECSCGFHRTTATGTIAEENRTIAVDPSVINYGSKVLIDGHIYTAEDCGGGVNGDHIDIFMESHEDVKDFGVQYTEVFVVRD